jgi:hypothetical protein
MSNYQIIQVFVFFLLGCLGCGQTGKQTAECVNYTECGGLGEALCLMGDCINYEDEYGGASVDLIFERGLYEIAASCHIWFFHRTTADGNDLDCSRFLAGQVDLDSKNNNSLMVEPKYFVLNWSGGNVFQNNAISFIRPTERAIVVVEGYQKLQAEGEVTVVGCVDQVDLQPLTIETDKTVEVVVNLSKPH